MKKGIIINAYSARNAGDAAIVLATADLLRRQGVEEILVSTRYFEEDRTFYQQFGIGVVDSIVSFPTRGSAHAAFRVFALIRDALVKSSHVFLLKGPRRRNIWSMRILKRSSVAQLAKADVVAICGGGYLYSSNHRINLSLVLAVINIWLASQCAKSVIMIPQSIGPINRRVDELLVTFALNGLKKIVVRERHSKLYCERHLQIADVELCPDVAFFAFSDAKRVSPFLLGASKKTEAVIGVVAMDWTWARAVPPTALRSYVSKLASALGNTGLRDASIRLIAHSVIPEHGQNDEVVLKMLQQDLSTRFGITSELVSTPNGLPDVQQAIQGCDLVISTRLHGSIVAVTLGVPTICLAYQPKALGTFDLIGLREFCLDAESFSAVELAELAVRMLDDIEHVRQRFLDSHLAASRKIEDVYLQLPFSLRTRTQETGLVEISH